MNKRQRKRLYKSDDKMLCGVCGGIAEYFDIDPTIVRVIFAMIGVCYASGIVLYVLLAIIMPDSPRSSDEDEKDDDSENRHRDYEAYKPHGTRHDDE